MDNLSTFRGCQHQGCSGKVTTGKRGRQWFWHGHTYLCNKCKAPYLVEITDDGVPVFISKRQAIHRVGLVFSPNTVEMWCMDGSRFKIDPIFPSSIFHAKLNMYFNTDSTFINSPVFEPSYCTSDTVLVTCTRCLAKATALDDLITKMVEKEKR